MALLISLASDFANGASFCVSGRIIRTDTPRFTALMSGCSISGISSFRDASRTVAPFGAAFMISIDSLVITLALGDLGPATGLANSALVRGEYAYVLAGTAVTMVSATSTVNPNVVRARNFSTNRFMSLPNVYTTITPVRIHVKYELNSSS